MKLSINLADREEIAAAVPLLQMILESTPQAIMPTTQEISPLYAEFKTAQAADPRAPITAIGHSDDPAVIFGQVEVPAVPLAPSIPAIAMPSINVPPPPAPPAPITTTPGPVSSGAVVASVELDSKGLPWDARIHAGSKALVKDGSWRMKKELDPALVASVEAELRAALGNSAPATVHTVPPAPLPAVPVGAALPITTASPTAAPATFEQLMPRITAAVTTGVMPPTAVSAACAAHGLPSVVALQQSPQFVPLVWATLCQQYPGL